MGWALRHVKLWVHSLGPKGLLLRERKGERERGREREREERETKEAQRRGRLRKPEQRQVMDPDSGEQIRPGGWGHCPPFLTITPWGGSARYSRSAAQMEINTSVS